MAEGTSTSSSDGKSTSTTAAKKTAAAKKTTAAKTSATSVSTPAAPTGSNTPVVKHGDHDRVGMLSVRADGTPDQVNPEMIGDPDVARAATEKQFVEQAVAAADVAPGVGGTVVEDAPQDPSIEAAQKAQLEAAEAARKAAGKAVGGLHPQG